MKLRHIADPTARTGTLFDNLSVEERMATYDFRVVSLGPLEAPTAQRSYMELANPPQLSRVGRTRKLDILERPTWSAGGCMELLSEYLHTIYV